MPILKEIISAILVQFSMFQCILSQIHGPQNGFVLLLSKTTIIFTTRVITRKSHAR